ncbi:MAG TPA: L-histidine N(alpha)-methyltransferase [Bryobacteraceae bacterium]|jgi:L-histidine N-alpha-methyltransferase|nr:L-histidine N(alpha)-methyltransferase [Bryobacteraceae bacterium]
MNEFACEVRNGLRKPRKELPSKYLYDELGSALFEAITVLPEYGLTRADQRVLEKCAPEIAPAFPVIAEFGSGSGRKARVIVEALAPDRYYPIDFSAAALERCRRELQGLAQIEPIEASYLNGLDRIPRDDGALLILFLGSTIGNFDPRCRGDFLRQLRSRLRPGDALLIGFDLIKPLDTMLEAYDDPCGVTASFNLNLLGRIDRELGGDFDLRAFAHEARYDHSLNRIEMHLRSRIDQRVTIRDAEFECFFRAGETIWTESSHKFDAAEIPEIARQAGFEPEAQWIDREWPFAENLWRAA